MTAHRPDFLRNRQPAWALAASLSASLGAGLLAAPAGAQTIVVGQGFGHDCYRNAVEGDASLPALAQCDRALDEVSSRRNRAATYTNRAIVRALRADFAGALEDVDDAADHYDFAETDSTRGVVYFHMGRYPEAADLFTRALESGRMKEPQKAYYNRALAYERLDMVPEAYYDYRAAADLAPGWEPPLEALQRFTVVEESEAGS